MASRRISSLLSRSLSTYLTTPTGKSSCIKRGLQRYSTAANIDEPITPPVDVTYTQLLINGKFVDAASGKTFHTFDPRTGNVIADVAEGDAEDVDIAVSAARKAFDEGPWPKMTAYERSKILLRAADLIEKHNDAIAALESWDNGKTYEQSANIEIPMLVRLFRYYAGWADKIHGLTVPADGPYHVQTLHEPIGVAGQIIPWNFPLLMFAWKVGPALACGNTVVLKTAEQTPLSALYVANLIHEAGIPPGVLNVISGFGPTAGAALCSHMNVDKLAFTGSTTTGQSVLQLAAKSNLKRVTLELGGKSPFIICEDADVDQAVEQAHFALFFNQGQCCCAGSRTFVHEAIYDEFVAKAKARAAKRAVGDPFKQGIEQGPQIDTEQFNKILRYIKSGVESGSGLMDSIGGGKDGDFLTVMKKACEAAHPNMKVQVEKVEQGVMDKATAVLSQTKSLAVDLLIIGQRRNLSNVFLGARKNGAPLLGGPRVVDTAEFLIENSLCTCVGVQKKSQNAGYLLNTRTHKNFWLLA